MGVIVASSELEEEEVLEAISSIVSVSTVVALLNGEVASKSKNVGLCIGSGHGVGLAHGGVQMLVSVRAAMF